MKKTKELAVVLAAAVAICFALVSEGQAASDEKKSVNIPIWQITKDGTADPVEWVDHEPNPRFAIYDPGTPTDETDDAVLDKETGLEWQRSVTADKVPWDMAFYTCYYAYNGNRRGWRMPTIEELGSLVDMNGDQPPDYDGEEPEKKLPMGHPFTLLYLFQWSSTTTQANALRAFTMLFLDGSLVPRNKDSEESVWCVRGGQGHDAY